MPMQRSLPVLQDLQKIPSDERVTDMLLIPQVWIRIIGIVLCVVALGFFVNPMLLGIRNVGCYVGTLVSLLGIAFFAANPMIAKWLGHIWGYDTGRFVLCIVYGFTALSCILAVAISIGMVCAMSDHPKDEAPVVILGCKVRGETPSLMLQKRLDAAIPYLKDHPDVQVIVCGGQGADESISEAACMTTYLQEHGIAAERIHQDSQSTSTYENLRNAKDILDENELGINVIIVTDGYHQLRASLIAKSLKLSTDAISAKTSWYLVPAYWVREWLGVCYQFVFG